MSIKKVLKEENARLVLGCRWLVWYQDEWKVFDHVYGAKNVKPLYEGNDLDEALNVLKG